MDGYNSSQTTAWRLITTFRLHFRWPFYRLRIFVSVTVFKSKFVLGGIPAYIDGINEGKKAIFTPASILEKIPPMAEKKTSLLG